MDISIIMGLLIALIIICATTIVNNLINKEYKTLKDKWKNRTNVLSDIIYEIGRLEENIYKLDNVKSINDETKGVLFEILNVISRIKSSVKSYERENF